MSVWVHDQGRPSPMGPRPLPATDRASGPGRLSRRLPAPAHGPDGPAVLRRARCPGVGRGPGPAWSPRRPMPPGRSWWPPAAAARCPCRPLRRDRWPGGGQPPLGALGLDRPAHLLECHQRRGRVAMDELGVIAAMTGVAIHDGWKPYRHYDVDHGLCNAHHLRELWPSASAGTRGGPTTWPAPPVEAKRTVEAAEPAGHDQLDDATLHSIRVRYGQLVAKGFRPTPHPRSASDRATRRRPSTCSSASTR